MTIGSILIRFRNKVGASQEEVCKGICQVSTYSGYEAGKKVPDMLCLQLFLERMGQSVEGIAVYVTQEEEAYMNWRNETEEIIQQRDYKKLQQILPEEPKNNISFSEVIREQYRCYLKGILAEQLEKNSSMACDYYSKALCATCAFLLEEDSGGRLSGSELSIYAVYLVCRAKKEPELSARYADSLYQKMQQIKKDWNEPEELVKIYPKLACVWAHLEGESADWEQQEQTLESAYALLREKRRFYHVPEILRLLLQCKKRLGKEEKDYQRAYHAIKELYEKFDYSIQFNVYEDARSIYMVTIVGEYLQRGRKKTGYTQEQASEGICEPESYSRMETGKRKPSRKNYKKISRKLEIQPRYYIELVHTGSTEAIRLRKDISHSMFRQQYTKARELLAYLKEELGDEYVYNKQYLEDIEACCAHALKEITDAEYIERCKQTLAYTMEFEDIGKENHIYTKVEINIINKIAAMQERNGNYKEGVRILEALLKDINGGSVSKKLRYFETILATLNLERLVTDVDKYERGNILCKEGIEMGLRNGRAAFVDEFIDEYSYNLEQMCGGRTELTKNISYLGLAISEMYATEKVYNRMKEFVEEHYGLTDYYNSSNSEDGKCP